jgi:hypothetical protein
VYGAALLEGSRVKHIRIDNVDKLYSLQGSKYLQSDMRGVFKLIKHDLDSERIVLFSGTGCQVAAVLVYFKEHKNCDKLYTVDLVCGGVPSLLLLKSFIAHANPTFKAINSFREKEKYIFSYLDVNNNIVRLDRALPLDGFKSCLTNRYSCYNCRFVGIHRKSDWTIGDLWGDRDGLSRSRSVCLCHNPRSINILLNLDGCIEKIDWRFIINNPRIVNGVAPFAKRFERIYLSKIFSYLPYSIIKKIYGSEVKKYDVLGLVYKVYKYVLFTIYYKKSKKKAKKIAL